MIKLIELHEQVKNHPFRLNGDEKYIKSYRDLLYKLSSEFTKILYQTKYKHANMGHDFNNAIAMLEYSYGKVSYKGYIEHVEKCIGTIHLFINTGEVPYYYTYYTGVNTLNSLPKVTKHIYEGEDYYSDYSVDQLKNAVKEIEESWVKNPKNKEIKYHIHSVETRDWLLRLLKRKENNEH